jgi:hypothetical protein
MTCSHYEEEYLIGSKIKKSSREGQFSGKRKRSYQPFNANKTFTKTPGDYLEKH